MVGHTILYPDHSPHQERRGGDVLTLLADLLAATKMGDRAALVQPFGPPELCDQCKKAYEEAMGIVEAGGGVERWSESAWRCELTPGQ
jgi:hypothetical protein